MSVDGSDSMSTPAWWRRFGIEWWSDLDSLLWWRVNWSNFTLVNVSGELEWLTGASEVEVALAGLHLRLTWYWPNEFRGDLDELVRNIEAGVVETTPINWGPKPTTLEALKDLADYVERAEVGVWRDWPEQLKHARAVIAKAEAHD